MEGPGAWWLCGADADWHAVVEAAEGSDVERVLLPGFGDMDLEGPRDVYSDERIASAEVGVPAELLLDMGEGGLLPQTCCDLSAVLNRKQPKVAVALLKHEVVCLPDLLRGGLEWEPGIDKDRFGECGVGAVLVAVFLGLRGLDVGGDGSALGGVIGCHDERSFLSVGSFIYYSVTGTTGVG